MQANVTEFLLSGHRASIDLTPRKALCRYAVIPTTQIHSHINLVGTAKTVTINLQDFLVVCVVRHPFDRLIS